MLWTLSEVQITAATVVAIASAYATWRGVGRLSFSHKKERTQRLYDLVESGKWRTVADFVLQQAVVDAFRRLPPHPNEIRFALDLPDSWRALRGITLAYRLVRADAAKRCWIDRRSKAWPSFHALSWGLFVIGCLLSVLLIVSSALVLNTSPVQAIIGFVSAIMAIPYFIVLSVPFAAAAQLLSTTPMAEVPRPQVGTPIDSVSDERADATQSHGMEGVLVDR